MSDFGKRIPKKSTNYTQDDIDKFLRIFHKCISEGRYSIALNENRQENVGFITNYRVNTRKRKEILLGLKVDDFCYTVENEKDEFAYEILYVFCKEQELDHWGPLRLLIFILKLI